MLRTELLRQQERGLTKQSDINRGLGQQERGLTKQRDSNRGLGQQERGLKKQRDSNRGLGLDFGEGGEIITLRTRDAGPPRKEEAWAPEKEGRQLLIESGSGCSPIYSYDLGLGIGLHNLGLGLGPRSSPIRVRVRVRA